jgi:hypothetical protein
VNGQEIPLLHSVRSNAYGCSFMIALEKCSPFRRTSLNVDFRRQPQFQGAAIRLLWQNTRRPAATFVLHSSSATQRESAERNLADEKH